MTLQDTIAFIVSEANESALDQITSALTERRKALRSVRAAAVAVGAPVRIGEISPKYLSGLTGEVVSTEGRFARILLDEDSTVNLRFATKRTTRFTVPWETDRYELGGVPLSCCFTD